MCCAKYLKNPRTIHSTPRGERGQQVRVVVVGARLSGLAGAAVQTTEKMAETTMKESLTVQAADGDYTLVGRPCELSSFSYVPTERHDPAHETYFNNVVKKDRYSHSTYDRLFHQDFGYNNKLHRCDREHAKSRGLTVNEEETPKLVPVLASSDYGKRLSHQLDPPDRKNVRIGYVQSEFYRRNIFNIKPPEGLGEL